MLYASNAFGHTSIVNKLHAGFIYFGVVCRDMSRRLCDRFFRSAAPAIHAPLQQIIERVDVYRPIRVVHVAHGIVCTSVRRTGNV